MNYDDLDSEEISEISPLNVDLISENLHKYGTQKICEIIVCARYFNLGDKLEIICMNELAKRRISGENFDFENFIENAQKELPPLDFSMPDLKKMLNQSINTRKLGR